MRQLHQAINCVDGPSPVFDDTSVTGIQLRGIDAWGPEAQHPLAVTPVMRLYDLSELNQNSCNVCFQRYILRMFSS